MDRWRSIAVWSGLAIGVTGPLALAVVSPLLAWREPVYIASGLAGIIAMALMLVQPLLASGYLPGIGLVQARKTHRWIGALLVLAVIIHVAGLWITSPPDVIDALLLRSPTPFSVWGVIAMWAVFATAIVALLRKPLRISPRNWRFGHTLLAVVIVTGTVVHALQIEGTMETYSKIALSVFVVGAAAVSVFNLRKRHSAKN
ncbi:MAG: ferric reductase-like transmembrane domain-containing protein [Pseudomonadota bacterium]